MALRPVDPDDEPQSIGTPATIDVEIAAAASGPPDMRSNVTITVRIAPTNRGAILNLPVDISDLELLELVAYMVLPGIGGLREQLAAVRGPALVVARNLPT